jgi:hypothetical protein
MPLLLLDPKRERADTRLGHTGSGRRRFEGCPYAALDATAGWRAEGGAAFEILMATRKAGLGVAGSR